MQQLSVHIWPTETVYVFEGGGVRLTMYFTTQLLPHDLELLAKPITYVSWDVQCIEGQTRDVQLLFAATSYLVVNTPN